MRAAPGRSGVRRTPSWRHIYWLPLEWENCDVGDGARVGFFHTRSIVAGVCFVLQLADSLGGTGRPIYRAPYKSGLVLASHPDYETTPMPVAMCRDPDSCFWRALDGASLGDRYIDAPRNGSAPRAGPAPIPSTPLPTADRMSPGPGFRAELAAASLGERYIGARWNWCVRRGGGPVNHLPLAHPQVGRIFGHSRPIPGVGRRRFPDWAQNHGAPGCAVRGWGHLLRSGYADAF